MEPQRARSTMSSSNSPCAACKLLRRKCIPPDNPAKFSSVHDVFGASNVSKLLNELPTTQREDAVNSLAYEAEARLRHPVYGCVSYTSVLQLRIKQARDELAAACKELAGYIGPAAFAPFFAAPLYHHHQYAAAAGAVPLAAATGMGLGVGVGVGPQHHGHHPHHQQQIMGESSSAAWGAAAPLPRPGGGGCSRTPLQMAGAADPPSPAPDLPAWAAAAPPSTMGSEVFFFLT